MLLFEELTDETNITANLEWMNKLDTGRELAKVKQQLGFVNKHSHSRRLWYFPVAASVIIVAMLWLFKSKSDTTIQPLAAGSEIMPPAPMVSLQLSNGTSIGLNAQKAWNRKEPGVMMQNGNGSISYYLQGVANDSVKHTLVTAPGSNYQLLLSDGTIVWLNAGTTITYPVAFNNKERVVHLRGEAYFQVKKTKVPFLVKFSDNTEITLLGQSFNVSTKNSANRGTLVKENIRFKNHYIEGVA